MSLFIIKIGVAIYITKFNAMTKIPNPKTSISELPSTNVIIDSVEIIGLIEPLLGIIDSLFLSLQLLVRMNSIMYKIQS